MADLPLVAGELQSPYECWQPLYEQMMQLGHAVAADIDGLLIQDAAPDPNYRGNKGWIPTSGGVPIYPGYVFVWHTVVGHWVARNPIANDDASRRIYVGTARSLATYDGGDANAPGIASGPFWEIDTAFAGSVPIGVGLIPTSSPAASITSPLDIVDSLGNGGSYQVSLTPDQIQHMHGVGQDPAVIVPGTIDDPAIQLHRAWDSSPETYISSGNDMNPTSASGYTDGAAISSGIFGTTKALADSDFPVVDAHSNAQPFIGVYFIKRTSRAFYVIG
jgi:hypothetical protein